MCWTVSIECGYKGNVQDFHLLASLCTSLTTTINISSKTTGFVASILSYGKVYFSLLESSLFLWDLLLLPIGHLSPTCYVHSDMSSDYSIMPQATKPDQCMC